MKNHIKNYMKKAVQPMMPYEEGISMEGISISDTDKENGSPKTGDMIAFNPNEPNDRWLVAEKFFLENYIEAK